VHNEANGDHRSGSQSKPPAIAASPSGGTDSGGVDETNDPPDGEAEGIITRKRPRATAAPAPAPATAATSVLARAVITAAAVASAQTRLNAIPGSKGYTARGAINFVSPDGTTFFSVDEVAEFIRKGGGGGGGSGGSGGGAGDGGGGGGGGIKRKEPEPEDEPNISMSWEKALKVMRVELQRDMDRRFTEITAENATQFKTMEDTITALAFPANVPVADAAREGGIESRQRAEVNPQAVKHAHTAVKAPAKAANAPATTPAVGAVAAPLQQPSKNDGRGLRKKVATEATAVTQKHHVPQVADMAPVAAAKLSAQTSTKPPTKTPAQAPAKTPAQPPAQTPAKTPVAKGMAAAAKTFVRTPADVTSAEGAATSRHPGGKPGQIRPNSPAAKAASVAKEQVEKKLAGRSGKVPALLAPQTNATEGPGVARAAAAAAAAAVDNDDDDDQAHNDDDDDQAHNDAVHVAKVARERSGGHSGAGKFLNPKP